jgi:hypothetical protein
MMAQSGKLPCVDQKVSPHARASFRDVSKILPKGKDKSNLRFSVNGGSDMDQEGQDSVGQGTTIHVGPGGLKFGERYRTFRSQTPKIRWSRYQSSIGICRGPLSSNVWVRYRIKGSRRLFLSCVRCSNIELMGRAQTLSLMLPII